MPSAPRFLGIDLGTRALHVVALVARDGRLLLDDARVLDPASETTADALARAAATVDAIAIDAPAGPSRACHAHDTSLAPKFRTARCGEIALGQQARLWVPWPTPTTVESAAPWMRVGFAAWDACTAAGASPIEVYPAGAFRVLAGGRIPSKARPAGLAARRTLLSRQVTPPPGFEMWSHDGLDAMVAALTAAHHARGTAVVHGHEAPRCDGSAVVLPPPGPLGS
jgi:hypothetical protein